MRKTSEVIWQDAQHQVLFEILDLIRAPGAGSAVFFRLKDYAESHFALEEQYMAALGYPDRDRHIEAHNTFRLEMTQLVDGEEPDALLRELIATFLTEWLKRHVFGIDKELEAFILQCGAR